MKRILQIPKYQNEIEMVSDNEMIPWDKFVGKSVLISGATGMIASMLIDAIMNYNQKHHAGIEIVALSRNEKRAKARFEEYWTKHDFKYIAHDITKPLPPDIDKVDYIIHAASNTHPIAYASDPIGTIAANVDGAKSLLEFARTKGCQRFVFLSSVEIYGENRGDVEKFDEKYMGYIDCNTMRAGYPESKRLGETLCHAYHAIYGVDFIIPRISRVYGPTLLDTDSKALSQFIHKAVNGEDIVLKSAGNQLFSYCYVTDVVSGILVTMLCGENGCAYNIADEKSDITLKDLSQMLADIGHSKVIVDLPDTNEAAGYSKATKALLDSTALEKFGWKAKVHIREGLEKTVEILRAIMCFNDEELR